jgi:NAD-dependent SIR2 family protein deacetylase
LEVNQEPLFFQRSRITQPPASIESYAAGDKWNSTNNSDWMAFEDGTDVPGSDGDNLVAGGAIKDVNDNSCSQTLQTQSTDDPSSFAAFSPDQTLEADDDDLDFNPDLPLPSSPSRPPIGTGSERGRQQNRRPSQGRSPEKTGREAARVSDAEIEAAAALLCDRSVVAFTGVGMAAESGVPTYRSTEGLWRKYDKEKVSHINNFLADPVSFWRFQLELHRLLMHVAPNRGHLALAELESMGVVAGIVTQNVEGLHSAAGSKTLVELHGNETRAVCLKCGHCCPVSEVFLRLGWLNDCGEIIEDALPDISPLMRHKPPRERTDQMSDTSMSPPASPLRRPAIPIGGALDSAAANPRERTVVHREGSSSSSSSSVCQLLQDEMRAAAPPGAPTCVKCSVGLLKPDAVYFGQKIDMETLKRAEALFTECNAALIVGSTCKEAPASSLPLQLHRHGGKLVEVNPQASRVSDIADAWLQGAAGDVLPRLAKAVAANKATRLKEQQSKRPEEEDVATYEAMLSSD